MIVPSVDDVLRRLSKDGPHSQEIVEAISSARALPIRNPIERSPMFSMHVSVMTLHTEMRGLNYDPNSTDLRIELERSCELSGSLPNVFSSRAGQSRAGTHASRLHRG